MSKSQVPIDGRPMNPLAPEMPEDCKWALVDGYPIGSGWQADIHRVYNRGGGSEFFALKLLKHLDVKARTRFNREIKALKDLDHPHIVKIVDCSNDGEDFQFYVMPFLVGARPIAEVIRSEHNPFKGDPVRSVLMFIQILEGLQECHAKNIVHRDLSPNNVLLLPDNSVQIIDFGICQQLDDGTLTSTNEGLGTRCYNAPECGAGSTERITDKADFYSAAKILWSVIVGAQAFEREEPVFRNKSMQKQFPNDSMCWHLQEIFEGSIRQDSADRWLNAKVAILETKRILSVIQRGFPPLENVLASCRSCGLGSMDTGNDLGASFGNATRELWVRSCSRCGFVEVRKYSVLKSNLESKSNLR